MWVFSKLLLMKYENRQQVANLNSSQVSLQLLFVLQKYVWEGGQISSGYLLLVADL